MFGVTSWRRWFGNRYHSVTFRLMIELVAFALYQRKLFAIKALWAWRFVWNERC